MDASKSRNALKIRDDSSSRDVISSRTTGIDSTEDSNIQQGQQEGEGTCGPGILVEG
jgi:hypothetical protein